METRFDSDSSIVVESNWVWQVARVLVPSFAPVGWILEGRVWQFARVLVPLLAAGSFE